MRIFRRKRDPIAALTARQPKTLKLAVAEFLQHYPEATIKVFKLGSAHSRKVAGYLPIRDAAEHIDEIEEHIKTLYGGGDFQLVLYDPVGNEYGSYRIGVLGKSNFPQMDEQTPGRGADGRFLQEIGMESIKQAMNPSQQLEGFAKILQLLQPQNGDDFQKELMTVLVNNHFTKEESQFENLGKALEMVKALQPTVQPEDPTTALVTSLAPLLVQMMASRQGGGARQNMQALLQDPQVAAAMSAAQQAQLGQAAQNPGLPEPGDQAESEGSADAGAPDPVEAAITSFRQHITQGTDTPTLTQMFLSMVGLARAWKPDHELFAAFHDETDWSKLSDAFDAFANAIPELAGNAALQLEIKHTVAASILLSEEPDMDTGQEDRNAEINLGQDGDWTDADRDDSEAVSGEIQPATASSDVPG